MSSNCGCHSGRCLIPPSPELRERMREELKTLGASAKVLGPLLRVGRPVQPGLNDGLIIPGSFFPAGTPLQRVRNEASQRTPLRGQLRVIVVLVDFSDQAFDAQHNVQHFEQLFFSRGVLENGSVREYYHEVSRGLIDIVGEVAGPYRMPRPLSEYAHGESGAGNALPNARTLARDAAERANRDVDFAPYDNDGNGFVDAFIVIHAGRGAEETGSASDIWSHKWVLPGGEYNADGTRIYAYLTVPEDARIGVCCHELGHLLFGWPDLYDIDGSSEGLGNWCLMAGGSWNGRGDIPAHPSAWCKADQGWVNVINQKTNAAVSIADVKDSATVYRLWKDGAQSDEYFLIENRQRRLYDRQLPGEGLLIFHVDDAVDTNADERHPKVALLQADGKGDLDRGQNRGDDGDCFPGSAHNTSLTGATTPSSRSYNGVATNISITEISAPGAVMAARLSVHKEAMRRRYRPIRDWLANFRWSEPLMQLERIPGVHALRQRMGEMSEAEAMGVGEAPQRMPETWARSINDRLSVIESTLQTLARQQLGGGIAPSVPSVQPSGPPPTGNGHREAPR